MNSQIKRILFTLSVLLVVVGIPLGVIYPTMREINSLAQTISNEYAEINERYRRDAFIRNIQKEYDDLIKYKPTLDSLAMQPGDELRFITQIEDLADELNIAETPQLNTGQKKIVGKYTKVPFILSASGQYTNIITFVHKLQNLPMVVVIDKIHLAPSSKANYNLPDLSVSSSIGGYIYEKTD